MRNGLKVRLIAGCALLSLAAPAAAETLREALIKAYDGNPTLTGARAGQRANDENVPIQKARGRPGLDLQGQYTENLRRSSNNFSSPVRVASARVAVDVPIYQGGGVRNSIKAADARVVAGQANLRDIEASLFSQVVAVYMDVIRDEAIVSLNQANVGVLDVNLQATQDRFEVGDLTRTDIAQSEARLAIAKGQLRQAEAQLVASRENYIRLVGNPPGQLEPPPPLPNVPANPDDAVDVAIENNPALQAAAKERDASRFDVGVARSARLPRISGVAESNYSNFLNSLGVGPTGTVFPNTSKSAAAGVQATLPLYQGGEPAAQVRQAQARESQAIEAVTETERGVIADTRAAFASMRAANEVIVSSQTAVDANRLSLEGVRAENSVGNRSILDILNAEQELLNSQVNLVTARRDAYVAGFSLLAAMGQAEARDLGLDGGTLYDPAVNYRRSRNYLWDWDREPAPKPVAPRTVDSPAQNPSVTATPGK